MTNALANFNFGFDPTFNIAVDRGEARRRFDSRFSRNLRIWICKVVKQGDTQADEACKMFYFIFPNTTTRTVFDSSSGTVILTTNILCTAVSSTPFPDNQRHSYR